MNRSTPIDSNPHRAHRRAVRSTGYVVTVALLALAAGPAPASAATFVADQLFDATLDPGAPPCVCRLSPRDPTCTLRAAIQAANACPGHDVVELGAPGTYWIQIGGSNEDAGLTGDLDVHEGLTLVGNGQQIQAHILDRVLHVDVAPGQNVDLLDVTILRGRLPASGGLSSSGGGVLSQGATLTLDNVSVRQCEAVNGAGLFMNSGRVMIIDSAFEGNVASSVGGGIVLDDVPATLQGAAFTQNSASTGGGLWAEVALHSALSIDGATFEGNEASSVGGGAFIWASTNGTGQAELVGVVFSGNSANYGGGLAAQTDGVPTELVVRSSIFSGNIAAGDGGGFAGPGTIEDSTFVSNRAVNGGAIAVRNGPLDIYGPLYLTNCTLHRNVATSVGGAIFAEEPVVASHLTLHANWASISGSSIWAVQMTLRSSIVSSLTSVPACSHPASVGYNVTSDGSCGALASDQTGVAPGLASYGSWGGPTPTFSLQPGSPAIDAADAAACPATDQRGLPRPSGAGCDVGSYEHQVP